MMFGDGRGWCYEAAIGGVNGWRLPTAAELMSLLDASQTNPSYSLPPGNPFLGVESVSNNTWWTSTVAATDTVYAVRFKGPSPGMPGNIGLSNTNAQLAAWCVRGPSAE